jgi:predicted amidohydrolase
MTAFFYAVFYKRHLMKKQVIATVVNKWRYRQIDKDYADVVHAIERNQQADIIVFPESCLVEFKDKADYQQKINGLQALSEQYNIIICIGLDEYNPVCPDKPYNAAFLIEEQHIHIYRKVHLVWDEPQTHTAGNLGFPVFNTSIGKIGVLICYDNVLPESMRCLALKGAEIICKISAWPLSALELWTLFNRTRARENQVFLLASNDCSQQRYDNDAKGAFEIEYAGHSCIVDPFGDVLVNITDATQPFSDASVQLDAEKLETVKSFYGSNTDPFKSRLPTEYKAITTE